MNTTIINKLNTIAREIQYALDWQVKTCTDVEITDDTHVMSVPVYPTRKVLKEWIYALDNVQALLSQNKADLDNFSDFDNAKEYFIKVFITPYKLDSATKNMMINSFSFGYKINEKLNEKTL